MFVKFEIQEEMWSSGKMVGTFISKCITVLKDIFASVKNKCIDIVNTDMKNRKSCKTLIITNKKAEAHCFYWKKEKGKKYILATCHSIDTNDMENTVCIISGDTFTSCETNPSNFIYSKYIDYVQLELMDDDAFLSHEIGLCETGIGEPEIGKEIYYETYCKEKKRFVKYSGKIIKPPKETENVLTENEFVIDIVGIPGESGTPIFNCADNRVVGMYRGDCVTRRDLGRCIKMSSINQDMYRRMN
ncbi:hypothetical protein MATL_G00186700 [Megalops atlanticus]|uniref:Uncharacterized protein n=1 Tax=Megalops atlanticus TaxID=7932 RepID=A0A9D3PKR6_MEGAT|nr:hypothetical protein MATL_G00186700 [Megalops atlanticus]